MILFCTKSEKFPGERISQNYVIVEELPRFKDLKELPIISFESQWSRTRIFYNAENLENPKGSKEIPYHVEGRIDNIQRILNDLKRIRKNPSTYLTIFTSHFKIR